MEIHFGSWSERLYIVKIAPKLLHRVTAVPIKIPAGWFANIDKLIKFIQKPKIDKIRMENTKARTILKKNKVGRFTLNQLQKLTTKLQ